jgi:hypothetical protein
VQNSEVRLVVFENLAERVDANEVKRYPANVELDNLGVRQLVEQDLNALVRHFPAFYRKNFDRWHFLEKFDTCPQRSICQMKIAVEVEAFDF